MTDARDLLAEIEKAVTQVKRSQVEEIEAVFAAVVGRAPDPGLITHNSKLVLPSALRIPCPELENFPFIVWDKIDATGNRVLVVDGDLLKGRR